MIKLHSTENSKSLIYLFIFILCAQILFSAKVSFIKPEITLIEKPYSSSTIDLLALGDRQFLFRTLATKLQNTGDIFAGFTSIEKYNYKNLYDWLNTLDKLDNKSNFAPALAAYIFGSSSNPNNINIIINYLENHSKNNIEKKWWWITQAIYLSNNILRDKDISIKLSNILIESQSKNIPLWTKRYAVSIFDKYNEDCASAKLLSEIIFEINKRNYNLSPEEFNLMHFFIENKIKNLKNKKFNAGKCNNGK